MRKETTNSKDKIMGLSKNATFLSWPLEKYERILKKNWGSTIGILFKKLG